MSACCTTQTRPAPQRAMTNAEAVPAPRSSPPPPAQASPDRQMPSRSCPQHRPASSASPAVPRDATTTLETAELLRRAGKGDPRAWQEILRRYSGMVFGKARAFRLQEADAPDAVQMTWLRLAENIHQIQHPEHLGGWLATTAARECLRILHQAQRIPLPTDALVDHLTDPTPGPEQRLIDAQQPRHCACWSPSCHLADENCCGNCSPTTPPSYAELSHATGIPLGSIGPTRNRALHQLRQLLEDHQLAPPPAQR
jgi:DNA-directed RNA polymerase specialized sigma24 family protein